MAARCRNIWDRTSQSSMSGWSPERIEQMKEPNPLEKLARHMVSALCEKQPQGPYYLGGFCCDGVFAYEVARQLTMYGHEVGLLALVEPRNPSPNFKRRMVNGLRRSAIQAGISAKPILSYDQNT